MYYHLIMNNKLFDYKDINLIPKLCIVNSRNDCDTSIQFGKLNFNLPIIPANMESVINENLCIELAKNNYFYIMHRFNIDIIYFIRKMKSLNLFSSISIGVNNNSFALINQLVDLNLIPDFITIDIAHGHSNKMKNIIQYIRSFDNFNNTFIIAGNIITKEAINDLVSWGANAIKIGIGNGFSCTTYNNTGFGSKDIQASIINECYPICKELNIPIIADGGITQISDISKAITLGASMVMIGSLLTGFIESPGKIVSDQNNNLFQEYYGSASSHSSDENGKLKTKNIEGTMKLIPFKNKSIFDFLIQIKEALQSSISYAGGDNLSSLKNVEFYIKK